MPPAPAGRPLKLFDSLTRCLVAFAPIDPREARVYSCGPTVYARQHLGNMRAYIFTDTLTRALRWKGLAVTHVINITDVGHLTSDADAGDDKIEKAAAAEKLSAWDVAARYTTLFKDDLAKLNVRPPTRWSLATDHIPDMIAFGEAIAGSTYEAPSGLYFDTTSVPDYGRLAGTRGGPEVGRIEGVEGKRHPADFAIWRRSERPGERQMEWESPWGVGAPGWHLECSVMSLKYLAEPFGQSQFDIHTGGIDHREIHHPNEIAQNQARSGGRAGNGTGANIWMHNNFLVERGAKMSKSSGGFATLDTLIDAGVHPLAYRLLCLSAHYRSELEFSAENVLAALTRLKRLASAVEKLRTAAANDGNRHPGLEPGSRFSRDGEEEAGSRLEAGMTGIRSRTDPSIGYPLQEFDAALSDDLNTPRALTHLETLPTMRDIGVAEKLATIAEMDEALGLGLATLTRADLRLRPVTATLTEADIEARLAARYEARAARDFARSDAIRADLTVSGVEVMDGDPLGWEWRIDLS